MTVPTPEPTPTPQAGNPASTPDPATPPAAATPPWGSDAEFNPEKAWNLIQGLKADKEKLSAREVLTDDQKAKLDEYDRLAEASKTELEKAQEAAAKLTPLQQENARLKVAIEKGLPANLIGRLQGDTPEALAADADALLSLIGTTPGATPPSEPQLPKPNPAQGTSGGGAPSAAEAAAQAAASGDWRTSIRLKSQQLLDAREQSTN